MPIDETPKLKVLFCLNHFLPHQIAGTEVYTWALSKGLQSKNYIIDVAIPNYGKSYNEEYDFDSIRVHKFSETSVVNRKLKMGFNIPKGVSSFKKLLLNLQPDVVHFHELAGSNGFTIHHVEAASKLGLKTVMTFHLASYSCKAGTLMYKDKLLCDGLIDETRCTECIFSIQTSPPILAKPLSATANLLYKFNIDLTPYNTKITTALSYPFIIKRLRINLHRLANNCNKLIVLTKWYEKILEENGISSEKIKVVQQALIPQGEERSTIFNLPEKNKIHLIFVGRISKFKGLHLILDALEDLSANAISLDVYGLDPETNYAKKCRKRIDEMECVTWKGWIHPEKVVSTMKAYDALILASTFSEMSPLVIQEAFAAGIPVIASDVYGNTEQIKEGINGLLFHFNRADLLKDLFERLIENPALLNDLKKNVKLPAHFTQVVDKYIKVYEEIFTNEDLAYNGSGILVPPKGYGGHERLVEMFSKEYFRLGHEVHLLVTKGSNVSGCIIHEFGKEGFPPKKKDALAAIPKAWKFLWKHRNDFDLVHNFGRLIYLIPILNHKVKKIMTYGREISKKNISLINKLPTKNLVFTGCSNNLISRGNVAGKWETIYNAIEFKKYTLQESVPQNAPLMFLGRIEKVKGCHTAIKIAKEINHDLIIAGNISPLEDEQAYFKNEIEPHIDGEQIKYLGQLDDNQKNYHLGRSKALLFPIEWNEPFGMVMTEAMACGTPVVGFNRGSVPEVIKQNVTGFVVDSYVEMLEAISKIGTINRSKCREVAESNFDVAVIAKNYLSIFN